MKTNNRVLEAATLGGLLCIGLLALGFLLSKGALKVKELERTVTVKGLSEREVQADIAIWPIRFNEASNDLGQLYSEVQRKSDLTVRFLEEYGFSDSEISVSQPAIIDKQAQSYGDALAKYRFTSTVTITVYSDQIGKVREAMNKIVDLGKQGIAITGQDYDNRTEFLFTGLNEIKPEMIEEATKNARKVADKFAEDSNSKLGKIKRANQGQFSIMNRDRSTQHIKKIRVVATVEYYLSD